MLSPTELLPIFLGPVRTPQQAHASICRKRNGEQVFASSGSGVIRPEVLVALGATAATFSWASASRFCLRGRVHSLRGTRLIVTYHPAYLLRDPRQKKEVWADLQIAMKELGLKAPVKG
jgi:uracil-DNA glycosylase family 4